jgi:glucose dehydrogenase
MIAGILSLVGPLNLEPFRCCDAFVDKPKFVALDQITKGNVGELEVAWFYPTNDSNTYTFNPIIVDSIMYVLAKSNSLVALNATTGEEIWIHANLTGQPRDGQAGCGAGWCGDRGPGDDP